MSGHELPCCGGFMMQHEPNCTKLGNPDPKQWPDEYITGYEQAEQDIVAKLLEMVQADCGTAQMLNAIREGEHRSKVKS